MHQFPQRRLQRTLEAIKPFAAAAVLAVLGGWIGFVGYWALPHVKHLGFWRAIGEASFMGLVPVVLIPATVFALSGTLLLPVAYYLSRRRWPVTPLRYALLGFLLAVAVLGAIVAWTSISEAISLQAAVSRSVVKPVAIGTLLAGAVCGSLFARMMRSHYQRYRQVRNEAV